MISRRTFLAYIRNKVAVGVLCSSMLTERLFNQPITDALDDPAYEMLGNVTRGTFSELLRPGLREAFQEAYADFPNEFTPIFKKTDGL